MKDAVGYFAKLGYPLRPHLHSSNPADFVVEVCFGMIKMDPSAETPTRVEDLGHAWETASHVQHEKSRRLGAREIEKGHWKARKVASARFLLRALLLKALVHESPDNPILHRSFPGSRIAEVALAEVARVERERVTAAVHHGNTVISCTALWPFTFRASAITNTAP